MPLSMLMRSPSRRRRGVFQSASAMGPQRKKRRPRSPANIPSADAMLKVASACADEKLRLQALKELEELKRKDLELKDKLNNKDLELKDKLNNKDLELKDKDLELKDKDLELKDKEMAIQRLELEKRDLVRQVLSAEGLLTARGILERVAQLAHEELREAGHVKGNQFNCTLALQEAARNPNAGRWSNALHDVIKECAPSSRSLPNSLKDVYITLSREVHGRPCHGPNVQMISSLTKEGKCVTRKLAKLLGLEVIEIN